MRKLPGFKPNHLGSLEKLGYAFQVLLALAILAGVIAAATGISGKEPPPEPWMWWPLVGIPCLMIIAGVAIWRNRWWGYALEAPLAALFWTMIYGTMAAAPPSFFNRLPSVIWQIGFAAMAISSVWGFLAHAYRTLRGIPPPEPST